MPCTTLLVGKAASYDGSTLMARNDDASSGAYAPKKFIAVSPAQQPRLYRSASGLLEIPLPEEPLPYTAMPDAVPHRGVWGEAGVNAENVAMTATETLTSNARVLGADPLVKDGIGEEDMLTIVLPYIHSAREGVLRLGALLEKYGTYEMNGIGFQDVDELWWFESVGGHHWMARRVPDDAYMVAPNQQAIDRFNFADALDQGNEYLCARDLADFVRDNHLDLSLAAEEPSQTTDFDTRAAFGSHSDSDHSYNTPRAWFMERAFNPNTYRWDGPDADFSPVSDDIPWCLTPERKITIEDIKYVLSSYYQGTPYNPYGRHGDADERGQYRPIGINRNNFLSITQLRSGMPKELAAIEWLAVGSNAFNAAVPFYAHVSETPAYLANTTGTVSTDSFYWANRLIGALTDAHYGECIAAVERYQLNTATMGHTLLAHADAAYRQEQPADARAWLAARNQQTADETRRLTDALLGDVLLTASNGMRNAFARSDA